MNHETMEPDASIPAVRRVAIVGLLCNVLLAALKFACGILGASQAVVADALHSLSDCTTDLAVLVGSRYWAKPADADHQYGHRRVEILVTVFIGLVLAAVGLGVAWKAAVTIAAGRQEPPGRIALYAVIVSIVAKELLFRWTRKRGRQLQSGPLVANAWHHRSDALSSVPAGLAVLGAELFPAWAYLDTIGALVVAVFILQFAWRITLPELNKLLDRRASKRTTEEICRIARETDGVRDTHAVRSRYVSGSDLAVDLHVLVDGDMSVRRGHEIAGAVRRRLLEQAANVVDVVVHIEPQEHTEEAERSVGPVR